MSMPPPGHPAHPEMQGIYGPGGQGWNGSYSVLGSHGPVPDTRPATQAALDGLLRVLATVVASSDPPDKARHSAHVGAPRFAPPPSCPAGHPSCAVTFVGDVHGKGSRRARYVAWEFPCWNFLKHEVEESDHDTSSAGSSYRFVTHHFHAGTNGVIYQDDGDDVRRVGSLRDGFDLSLVPMAQRSPLGGLKPLWGSRDLLHAETNRWRTVVAGQPDPTRRTVADTYAEDVVLPWLLEELRKRNNPDLQTVPGTGLLSKKGFRLIQPCGWLLLDGTIKGQYDKRPRPVYIGDLENLLSLARLSHLGNPTVAPPAT